MPIEQKIDNFNNIYAAYRNSKNEIEARIIDLQNHNQIINLIGFNIELTKFDAKLRLGMAVTEILLNENYVQEKTGELKECHLMLYKLADIWFSYDTFFRIFNLAFNTNSTKNILWLDYATNSDYSSNIIIGESLTSVNVELRQNFGTEIQRNALKEYLNYCAEEAKGSQKNRLILIADNIDINNVLPNYSHSDILTITYAIRNNFVHNGEITIYPEEFNYKFKNVYLKTLYKYLLVITVVATTITLQKKLKNI